MTSIEIKLDIVIDLLKERKQTDYGRYMTAREARNELGYKSLSSLEKYTDAWKLKDPNVKGHKNYLTSKVLDLKLHLLSQKK